MSKTIGDERHRELISILRGKREAARITQADLASQLGVYQSHIARLESGQRRLDVIEFLDLAEAIGFEPQDVIATLRSQQRIRSRKQSQDAHRL